MRMPKRARMIFLQVGMGVPLVSHLPLSLSDRLQYSWLLLRQRMVMLSAQTMSTLVQMASSGTFWMYYWSTYQLNQATTGLADTQPQINMQASRVMSYRAQLLVQSCPFSRIISSQQVFLHFEKYPLTSLSNLCQSLSTCSSRLVMMVQKLYLSHLFQSMKDLVYCILQVMTQSMTASRPSCSSFSSSNISYPQRVLRWDLKAQCAALRVCSTLKTELLESEGFISRRVLLSFCLLSMQSPCLQLRARMQQNYSLRTLYSDLPQSEKPYREINQATSFTDYVLIYAIQLPIRSYCLDYHSWFAASTMLYKNQALSSGVNLLEIQRITDVRSEVNLRSWWRSRNLLSWRAK